MGVAGPAAGPPSRRGGVMRFHSRPGEERLEQQQDIEFVRNYIKDIAPERNKHIFEDYYGLREDDPINMTTLATKFGVSKQRCQQIISREIRKMKELYSTIDS